VQVQAELAGQDLIRAAQSIPFAALRQEGEVDLVRVAAEDLPGHLDVAVGRDVEPGPAEGFARAKDRKPIGRGGSSGEGRYGS
jgi:hypothetical protein